jgi:hypothetical protein
LKLHATCDNIGPMMGRGTKLILASVAAVCIAAAFLSPLFTSRAPLAHGKNCGGSGQFLVAASTLFTVHVALGAQMRRAEALLARGNGVDLLALTCTRLC